MSGVGVVGQTTIIYCIYLYIYIIYIFIFGSQQLVGDLVEDALSQTNIAPTLGPGTVEAWICKFRGV